MVYEMPGRSSNKRYRRRVAPILLATSMALISQACAEPNAPSTSPGQQVVPVDANVLRNNIRYWTTDYAVMFYAPWCTNCKYVFKPIWNYVAMHMALEDPKGKRKLVMASFNCEQDETAQQFCKDMNLLVYPTFAFFGRGTLHAHDPVSDALAGSRPPVHRSAVKFPKDANISDIVLLDWINSMYFLSRSNGWMSKINPFRRRSQTERLTTEVDALEQENQRLRELISNEARKDVEDGSLYGYGDVFSELAEVTDPILQQALGYCILEVAHEYCQYPDIKELDPWCNTVEVCIANNGGDGCFPASCPMLTDGCEYTSQCLHPDVIEAYEQFVRDNVDLEQVGAPESPASETGTERGPAERAPAERAHDSHDPSDLPPFLGRVSSKGHTGGEKVAEDRGEFIAT